MPVLMLAFVLSLSTLVNALGLLLVVCVLVGLIAYCVNQMNPPEPFRWLIWGIIILAILIGSLKFFGVLN